MGGIAIALGTIAGVAGTAVVPERAVVTAWPAVLVAALTMSVVGMFDDRLQLSPVAKLVSSLAIGAFLVFALTGSEPAGAFPTSYTLIGTLWFAGVCHAFNLLDNMDGLAAGVALIASLFLAALLSHTLGPALVLMLIALAGALGGFLYWNRPQGRLLMGGGGSMFLVYVHVGGLIVVVLYATCTLVTPTGM